MTREQQRQRKQRDKKQKNKLKRLKRKAHNVAQRQAEKETFALEDEIRRLTHREFTIRKTQGESNE